MPRLLLPRFIFHLQLLKFPPTPPRERSVATSLVKPSQIFLSCNEQFLFYVSKPFLHFALYNSKQFVCFLSPVAINSSRAQTMFGYFYISPLYLTQCFYT